VSLHALHIRARLSMSPLRLRFVAPGGMVGFLEIFCVLVLSRAREIPLC
jgi:hypothetical protein